MADADLRLPPHVVPRHYDLELEPDLDGHRFAGSVGVDLDITRSTDELCCHAAELAIDSAHLVVDSGKIDLVVTLDDTSEQARFQASGPLPAGPARLELTFTGVLNDQLRGFYRSTYVDDRGTEHTIATTQFQSTDARRAFPCWDEPAFKATFAVTLVVEPDLLAIANTSEIGRQVRPDGRHEITFAPTMPMSTYLVAFVVGPLEVTETVDVDGVPLRVVHRPGRGHLTGFAVEVAAHALRWLSEYYDIPYPSDKVDLVAIPDFAAGAMENLGCVTFREVLVLIDPATASQPELQSVTEVISHELAHMWFGDLVTMRWWEGIWLNEAFATFMELACTDAFRPDWKVWTSFGRMRSAALGIDELASTRAIEYPVVTPEDAEDMFDLITYEKGASVLLMLERYLGAERFRDGVRHYLRRHSHSNTATTDLWDAIEHVSGQPVRSIMDGWILRGGHPVITARPDRHGLWLEQRHFTLDPDAADDRQWAVPVRIRTQVGAAVAVHAVLLDRRRRLVTGLAGEVLSVNADGTGFYRVSPVGSARERLERHGTTGLGVDERHALIDDLWASTVAGWLDAIDYLQLATTGFATEDDVTVWQAMSAAFGGLRRLVDGEAMDRFAAATARICGPLSERLGERRSDDDDRTRELRATILRLRGAVADLPDAIAQARRLLDDEDGTLAAAALTVVAHHGSASDFDRFLSRFLEAADPQSEQRHLRALADFPDPDLVMVIVEETRNGKVRSQDGPYLIRRALGNRRAGPRVWAFVVEHWDELNATFPRNSIVRMLEGIVTLDAPDQARDVESFLRHHPVPQSQKQLEQHLERLRINVALRAREGERFPAALIAS